MKPIKKMICMSGLLALSSGLLASCGNSDTTPTNTAKADPVITTEKASAASTEPLTEAISAEAPVTEAITEAVPTDPDNLLTEEDMEYLKMIHDAYTRKFYGTMIISNAKGACEEYNNYQEDCIMTFDFYKPIEEVSVGMDRSDCFEADLALQKATGINSNRVLFTQDVTFHGLADWGGGCPEAMDIYVEGNIRVSYGKEYTDLLIMTGETAYDENTKDSFSFVLYVRPWGMKWDDIRKDHPEMIPKQYEDWYLPQL